MKLSVRVWSAVAVAAVLMSGCQTKSGPTAADTRSSPDARGEWANGERGRPTDPNAAGAEAVDGAALDGTVAGLDGTGLEERDGASLAGGEEVRGLLADVLFDYDQAAIKGPERTKLEQAFAHLKAHPQDRLLIEGHCDWRGTPQYNAALGDRRANAARDFLVTLGVAPERIATRSKGDLEADVEGSPEKMAQDRRASLVVLR